MEHHLTWQSGLDRCYSLVAARAFGTAVSLVATGRTEQRVASALRVPASISRVNGKPYTAFGEFFFFNWSKSRWVHWKGVLQEFGEVLTPDEPVVIAIRFRVNMRHLPLFE